MNKTSIEYLTHTWSPIAMRCSQCSPGCAGCWHLTRCDMFKNNSNFSKELREIYAGDRPPKLIESRLNDPLKRKKPARIGVQFMGDLFHPQVSFKTIETIFDWALRAQRHNYLFLTKRPKRMVEMVRLYFDRNWPRGTSIPDCFRFGVTVENQQRANERIPILLQIPATVRFVSVEPMLSKISFRWASWKGLSRTESTNHLDGLRMLDWIIVGGESGPGARPMELKWARSLRDQCQEAGVPFFMKQMSKKAPISDDLMIREYPKEANHADTRP